ncbi:hypothetical protein T492DRAFT_1077231 [Pavlovales sp. CCMP2436]|nr:hypothetical protein T492DRAFT_1077231 [Pavlovales sp. CCMP2436]
MLRGTRLLNGDEEILVALVARADQTPVVALQVILRAHGTGGLPRCASSARAVRHRGRRCLGRSHQRTCPPRPPPACERGSPAASTCWRD